MIEARLEIDIIQIGDGKKLAYRWKEARLEIDTI